MPFNIAIWGVVAWFFAFTINETLKQNQFQYPDLWRLFLVFPALITLSIFVVEVNQPINWLFRQIYISSGALFLLALFQFSYKRKFVESILFSIVLACGLHAIVSVMQVFSVEFLPAVYKFKDMAPRGVFQQVNVNVTFLATGALVSMYLISCPSFRHYSSIKRTLLIISSVLSFYIIFISGSRTGLLAIIIAVPIIVVARFNQLSRQKPILLLLAVMVIFSLLMGQQGIEKTADKTAQLSERSYSTARVAIYTIGTELVLKEPMGYGIGSFLKAWNEQASDFIKRHPETRLPADYVGHPHNEILFWMIEGGIPAVIGIFIMIIGICVGLYRCGFQRGGAYAAMLVPISLHTQVELPFYISSLHWFIWLFLIYIVLSHETKTAVINLSTTANKSLQIFSIFFVVLITFFMINTAHAQKDIYKFVRGIQTEHPPLSIALNNLYTQNYAEQLAMRSNLYVHIENKNTERVKYFVLWAKNYVNKSPELKMYEDLISASVYLNPAGKGCDMINEALTMYAHNKPLQKARDDNCS